MDRVLGDYAAFFDRQVRRLADLGISIDGCRVSHLAFRTATVDEYLATRSQLEARCIANVENVWNGRPISKVVLAEPLRLSGAREVRLVELIPPPHQDDYQMGLEHVGFALDERFDAFASRNQRLFTGRQFQSEDCQPYFIRFPDRTNVKFYVRTLLEYCVSEGRRFDGIHHAAVKS